MGPCALFGSVVGGSALVLVDVSDGARSCNTNWKLGVATPVGVFNTVKFTVGASDQELMADA